MPRPKPAQLVYGSATVILSALVMLLVSQARSGTEVVVVACASLALGLLVSAGIPAGRTAHRASPAPDAPERRGAERRVPQTSSRR